MSNRRHLKPKPRPPDDTELAFRDALRAGGCRHCGSKRVIGRFGGAVWRYTLLCNEGCPALADETLAHAIAARAAARAALSTGERLSYRAFDQGGAVEGAVVATALAGGP